MMFMMFRKSFTQTNLAFFYYFPALKKLTIDGCGVMEETHRGSFDPAAGLCASPA